MNIAKLRNNRVLPLLSAFLLIPLCVYSQKANLEPVNGGELKGIMAQFDLSLLPDGYRDLQIDSHQVFHLTLNGKSILTIVPVQLRAPTSAPDGAVDVKGCGVFLVREHEASNFIWTTGDLDTGLTVCMGTEAIGIQTMQGTYPAIIAIFDSAIGSHDFSDPYVLVWNKTTKKYEMDDSWKQRLTQPFTIRNIKRQILQYKEQSNKNH